jgi:hypothetical protein
MEAETEVLDPANPLGAIDHAALRGRNDFAAGHIDDRDMPSDFQTSRRDAGLAALHALHVGDRGDRACLNQPNACGPAGRMGTDECHDVELQLLLEELLVEVPARRRNSSSP